MTKEAVIIKAQAALENIRGISVSENWHNSRPVTLSMLIEEAIESHPEIMWFGEDLPDVPLNKNIFHEQESAQDMQESAQDMQESAQDEQEGDQDEQESDQVAPAGAAEEDTAPAAVDSDHGIHLEKSATPTVLGKWAEYQARALSNDEINFVIKNMRNEGYSFARISTVVRLTPPAVSARYAKISKE